VDVRSERAARDPRPIRAASAWPGVREVAELRRSVVYLEDAPVAAFEVNNQTRARMDQRNERSLPNVLAITAGTWVDFPQRRPHVSQRVLAVEEQRLQPRTLRAGDPRPSGSRSRRRPRLLRDPFAHERVHPGVRAPFFAVTDDEGRYRLDGVPPGTYTLAVWNETVRGDPPRRTVTIGDAGGDVEVDFSIR
jgi:hypothetical protein